MPHEPMMGEDIAPMQQPVQSARPKVLVIDDQEINLRLMRAYLGGVHYQVVTCSEPQQALQLIEQESPDLVLLDLMMPVLDGFAILGLLRQKFPQLPVLVITALNNRDARLRGLDAGARDYLTKPVDRSELLIRVRNLTDVKKANDALGVAVARLQAANRDLDAFAGSLAHDLRQPVTTIIAFAHILEGRAEPPLSPSDAKHLKRIIGAAESANRMIQGLLDFARLGQKKIEAVDVDLNKVVSDARTSLVNEIEGRAIAWTIARLPIVRGDPSLLLLAFVNLLSNAIKYTRTREQPSIEIDCSFDPVAGHSVGITDNGVGFEMAFASKLFKPFERLHTTAEFEGTGMGLANVRRIMERQGGSVRAKAAPDRGATFTLLFPQ